MEEKYFVASEGEEPIKIFFDSLTAFVSGFTYIDSFDEVGNSVYKYIVKNLATENIIRMPIGAEIIPVAQQHKQLVVWAIVDPKQTTVEPRIVKCVLTGQVTGLAGYVFLDTILLDNGNFVVHVFKDK
jgi:hypothetical protein